jgi:hypothetical protein
MTDFVSEADIDYDEIFRRGGRNLGDEDFAFFKCPSCCRVYLAEYEVDTVYVDGGDLSKRQAIEKCLFDCLTCGHHFSGDRPWIGDGAPAEFQVTWNMLARSSWAWAVRRLREEKMTPNQTLETNRRPASPLDAGHQFGRAVYAQACISGGGRSAIRWAQFDLCS